MTANIGCDAANYAYILPDTIIFTCEIDKAKIKCLKYNLKPFKNVYIFEGNSTKLLEALFKQDLVTINQMSVSRTITNDIFKYQIVVNIDPPFSDDYKSNISKLTFDNKDIIDYCYEHKSTSIKSYIIKSPQLWNVRQIYNLSGVKVLTNHSCFYYNFMNKTDLTKIYKLLHVKSISKSSSKSISKSNKTRPKSKPKSIIKHTK
jgi:hypothetical protein